MSNWQLISTAPQDGEPVILYSEGIVCVGYFDNGCDDEGDGYEEPGWYWFDAAETGPAEPTHWMPMPAAPTGESLS